jgi:uncharacterized membrane protein
MRAEARGFLEDRSMKHATITESTFIGDVSLGTTAKPRGRPLHKIPVSFSAAYFVGALVTDVVYWQMPDVVWERFSIWLITAGLLVAGLAVIAYIIDLVTGRQIDGPAWPRAIGYALAISLSLFNAFVHSRDGYTAVVPTGLMLSGLVVAVLVLTAGFASALPNRQRIGG